ncbi:MAG: MotA/TolQ/ExbB proton channel family protein [Pseudomonadota bacterium]|nr:MotA/TolQ/ExbB proton channel family protein [Pseudomonadota bacterium]
MSAVFVLWQGAAVYAQAQDVTPFASTVDSAAPDLTAPGTKQPDVTAPSLGTPSLSEPTLTPTSDLTPRAEPVTAAPVATATPAQAVPVDLADRTSAAFQTVYDFLQEGGSSIWAIAALAVVTLALILWKIWRLALMGAWSKGKAWRAVAAFEAGAQDVAAKIVDRRRGVRSKVVAAAVAARSQLPDAKAREEVARVAKNELAQARVGLGALELISTIAPLLGLLGTVLGMITAFQALQAAGSKADPALLAGGIWEALLTTAAGMAVAIPASAALTWFEAVIDRIRGDVEDAAVRLFVAPAPEPRLRMAAE